MDRSPENVQELIALLDEITTYLPMYSYTQDENGISLQLKMNSSEPLPWPTPEGYLAAKGVLYKAPILQQAFSVALPLTEADLTELYKTHEACPCHAKSEAKTCPALRGGMCSLAKAACPCPWDACQETHVVIRPKTHLMANDALTNAAVRGVKSQESGEFVPIIGEGAVKITLAKPKGKHPEIMAPVKLYNECFPQLKQLSPNDKIVYDAVISLYRAYSEAGYKKPFISIQDIKREIAHTPTHEGERPTPAEEADIIGSIELLSSLRCDGNYEEFFAKKGIKNPKLEKFERANFLYTKYKEKPSANGGQDVKGYEILEKPFVWELCETLKQFLSMPACLIAPRLLYHETDKKTGELLVLENPAPFTFNSRRKTIYHTLLWRVERIRRDVTLCAQNPKRKPTESRKILLEDVFTDARLQGLRSATQKADARKFVFQVLDFWKTPGCYETENESYIRDYKKITGAKRAIVGFEILL